MLWGSGYSSSLLFSWLCLTLRCQGDGWALPHTCRCRLKFRFPTRTLLTPDGEEYLVTAGWEGTSLSREDVVQLVGMHVPAHYLASLYTTLAEVLGDLFYLSYLVLSDLLGSMGLCLSLFLENSQPLFFFQIFLLSCFPSSPMFPVKRISDHLILFHSSLVLFSVLICCFFSLYFNLGNSYSSIFTFTTSFLGCFEPTVIPLYQ